jgi:CubicO group peptidase (beta-lactamase class C family)
MKSSTLLYKGADPELLAAGHHVKGKAVTVVQFYPYNRAHTPSSNLHSNIEDMSRWAIANMNRGELDAARILKDSTYDLMWKPAAERRREVGAGSLVRHNGTPTVFTTAATTASSAASSLFPRKAAAGGWSTAITPRD